jgi:hypothetical protein
LPMRKKEKEAEEEQCFRIPEVTWVEMASNKNTQRRPHCTPTSCSVEGNFRSLTLSRDPGTRRRRKSSNSRHLKKIISGPGDEVQPPDFSKHKMPVWSDVPKTKQGRNILFLFSSKCRRVKHFFKFYIGNQETLVVVF